MLLLCGCGPGATAKLNRARLPGSPTVNPSMDPSTDPSTQPSTNPSTQPSTDPSTQPSTNPSTNPSTSPSTSPSPSSASSPWLSISGNHIVRADGSVWIGRGANLHDTRSCGAGTANDGTPLDDDAAGLAEVERRVDALTGTWKATFIRLVLESRRAQDDYVADATYRGLVRQMVAYIASKNVYVLVSVWDDPSLDANGWPTDTTNTILAQLATDFYDQPYVLYGVSNEPQANYDGSLDAQVLARMNAAVQAIRDAEAALGPRRHIVTVQGTRDWARDTSYYVDHPVTAGGGVNIAYETHIYNSPGDFDGLLAPSASIPLVMGEYGPVNDQYNQATLSDVQTLMNKATAASVPYLAWTFHQDCSPNLIGMNANMTWDTGSSDPNGGLGMTLNPTDFGKLLMTELARY
jgi:endoglucanase